MEFIFVSEVKLVFGVKRRLVAKQKVLPKQWDSVGIYDPNPWAFANPRNYISAPPAFAA